jgi:hypothetical protein
MTEGLEFKVLSIINKREIVTLVNGVEWHYLIDGALLPEFRLMQYKGFEGMALNFLKKYCLTSWKEG